MSTMSPRRKRVAGPAWVAASLLAGVLGCTHSLPPQRFSSKPVEAPGGLLTRGQVLEALPEVEELVAAHLREQPLPSLALGLVTPEGLVWSQGYGAREEGAGEPVGPRTVFRIGSVTKVLTALAVLKLRDEGRVALDEPAVRYLPELAGVIYPSRDSPPITLRHLLTHSSGLPRRGSFDYTRSDRDVTEAEVLASLEGLALEFAPGTAARYSNLGMAVVGLVIQRASGMSYRRYVSEQVLRPLGMKGSAWERESVPAGLLAAGHVKQGGQVLPGVAHWRLGAAEAMGGLYASMEDMAALVAFELAAWPPRDEPETGPVRRGTVRESQLATGTVPGDGAFGLGWMVPQAPELGHVLMHNGATANYSASVLLLPQRGMGVVALAGTGAEAAPELDALVRKVVEGLVRATARQRGASMPAELAAGLEHLKAMLAEPSVQTLEEHLSPSFRERVPLQGLLGLLQHLHSRLGACASHQLVSAEGARSGVIRLACERGAVEATLSVEPQPPHLLTGVMLRPAR